MMEEGNNPTHENELVLQTPQEIVSALPVGIRTKAVAIFDALDTISRDTSISPQDALPLEEALTSLKNGLSNLYQDPDRLGDLDSILKARASFLFWQSQQPNPEYSQDIRQTIQEIQRAHGSQSYQDISHLRRDVRESEDRLKKLESKTGLLSKLLYFQERDIARRQVIRARALVEKRTDVVDEEDEKRQSDQEVIDMAARDALLKNCLELPYDPDRAKVVTDILQNADLNDDQQGILIDIMNAIGTERILDVLNHAQQKSKFSEKEKKFLSSSFAKNIDTLVTSDLIRQNTRPLITQDGARTWIAFRDALPADAQEQSEYLRNMETILPLRVVKKVAQSGKISADDLLRITLGLGKVDSWLDRTAKSLTKTAPEEKPQFTQEFRFGHLQGLDSHVQWINLSPVRRKALLRQDLSDHEKERLSRNDMVSSKFISDEYKLILLKNILHHVLEDSQDPEKKNTADERNRGLVEQNTFPLTPGTLLHGSSVSSLGLVLVGGERSGDFLGPDSKEDWSSYGCDFTEVQPFQDLVSLQSYFRLSNNFEAIAALNTSNKFTRIYYQSIAARYGATPDIDRGIARDRKAKIDDGVTLIFDRSSPSAFLKGTEYPGPMVGYGNQHKLILVGLPATEISGLIINKKYNSTVERAKQEITRNGFYIPIYDIEGNVIFTPADYDKMREL